MEENSEKIATADLSFTMTNCPICGKLTNDKICLECMQSYHAPLKAFIEQHPGITYMEAICHTQRPVPRNVIYEFDKAGILKIRNK